MTVFTGETGAGKSIFVNALNLLCGARLSGDIVGTKANETKIEGIFMFTPSSNGYEKCLEYDFDPTQECVFSRTITNDGRSNYKINRQNVTLSIVRDILQNEVDIHSQFDTTYLKDEGTHLDLIDEFHGQKELLTLVSKKHKAIGDLQREKEAFEKSILTETEREFLDYQINEIEQLNPDLNEELETNDRLEELRNFEQNYSHFSTAKELIEQVDTSMMYSAIESLEQVKSNDQKLTESLDMLRSSYYELEEVNNNLSQLLDQDSFNLYEFEQLQQRSFEYTKLKRKYKLDTQGLIDFLHSSKKQIEDSENQTTLLSEYDQRIEAAKQDFNESAKQLRHVRAEAAGKLQELIISQLGDLALPNARFETEFYPKVSAKGLEDCRFLISVNKGQTLGPLSKVASGGELSRFMLGMKVIFNRLQKIECVVFDEIDTGISGPVALQVGLKMAELAKDCLVITVTHLPAVASCGDTHYVVEKMSDDTKTMVTIAHLEENERIQELAAMGFTDTSESSLLAAKELLEKAREAKTNE